ncbi:MAG: YceI family protein [Acidobacteriota bacterium]
MSTAVQPVAARTTWTIDPVHSSAEFAIRHLMITTVRGRFTDLQGIAVTDDADLTQGSVEVTIGVASIDTREAQRDAHLRSPDFFDAEKFSTMTFKSSQIRDASGDAFKLVGDLTIHGVTRQIVLDAKSEGRARDPWGGDRAGFHATTTIKRSDFGLTWNQLIETGGLAVADDVKITLDVQLLKQIEQG